MRRATPARTAALALRASRGVEVGNIFKLGTRYTEALGGDVLDENGETQPVIMGSYGIGVGRLLACIAEEHHDEHGLVWPAAVAAVPGPPGAAGAARAGVSEKPPTGSTRTCAPPASRCSTTTALESPGIKFNDADLIGLPLRITVAERAMKQGAFEFKRRRGGEVWLVPMADAVEAAGKEIRTQLEEMGKAVKTVKYSEDQ